jgi:hypothetical protein
VRQRDSPTSLQVPICRQMYCMANCMAQCRHSTRKLQYLELDRPASQHCSGEHLESGKQAASKRVRLTLSHTRAHARTHLAVGGHRHRPAWHSMAAVYCDPRGCPDNQTGAQHTAAARGKPERTREGGGCGRAASECCGHAQRPGASGTERVGRAASSIEHAGHPASRSSRQHAALLQPPPGGFAVSLRPQGGSDWRGVLGNGMESSRRRSESSVK